MLNFMLWYLVISVICNILYIALMLNYSKKRGEW